MQKIVPMKKEEVKPAPVIVKKEPDPKPSKKREAPPSPRQSARMVVKEI